jgi:di/tricarboxylate transporter
MAGHLKLYPDVPSKRRSTIFRDLALLALVLLFAWLGLKVHDAVNSLAVLGSGVKHAGLSVQDGFGSAAGVVKSVPLVGGSLANALEGAGKGSGGNVAALGQKGEDSVHHLALMLGLLVFLLPTILVLVIMLPSRIRQIRELGAANAALVDTHDPERRRLLAMRAAFGLSYLTLLGYTSDPLGDLAAGRYDQLVAAALDDVGIRRPPPALAQ